MSLTSFFLITAAVFIGSFGLLSWYQILAGKLNLLDRPNERSSHTNPTPLGAGIVFLVCILPAVGFIFYIGGIGFRPLYIIFAGSIIYTLLGFIDDVKTLKAMNRLIPQLLVASWVLLELTMYLKTPFIVKFLPIDSSYLAFGFGVLFVAWMVNLFNFMDGLDGFLGGQAVLYGILLSILVYLQGDIDFAILYSLVPAVVLPFLYFNWRPAKMFMGDAGAYFLGFFFAVLGLLGKIEYGLSLVAPVILMGSLICDATLTLMFRLLLTGRIFQGHQTHGFQILRHRLKWRTSRVVFAYVALTLFWFFPWATAAVYQPSLSVFYCFISYSPVILGLFFLGVGRSYQSE